jgi:hypothetical protein
MRMAFENERDNLTNARAMGLIGVDVHANYSVD